MQNKILITGLCYIYRLLEMRIEGKVPDCVKVVYPHFDINQVEFCTPRAEDLFEVRRMNREPNYDFFNEGWSSIYWVATLRYNAQDFVDYDEWVKKVAQVGDRKFVCRTMRDTFIHDPSWQHNTARMWLEHRNRLITKLLAKHPNLKFVLFRESHRREWCKYWPKDRALFWKIDYGGAVADRHLREVNDEMRKLNMRGVHRYPTEQSYNDLFYMLIDDDRKFGNRHLLHL